jgi:hypothetical protein
VSNPKTAIRKRVWSGSPDNSAKSSDVGNQSRDIDAALQNFCRMDKVSTRSYAAYPLYIGVTGSPYMILARITPALDPQNKSPQGGIASFSYDAVNKRAIVTGVGAYDAFTNAGLLATVLYQYDFLVVY